MKIVICSKNLVLIESSNEHKRLIIFINIVINKIYHPNPDQWSSIRDILHILWHITQAKKKLLRVIRLAGDDGNLTKESFIKILKSSDFFMKAFDKNKDGIVTEVDLFRCLYLSRILMKVMSEMKWRCTLTSIQNMPYHFCATKQNVIHIFFFFHFWHFYLPPWLWTPFPSLLLKLQNMSFAVVVQFWTQHLVAANTKFSIF